MGATGKGRRKAQPSEKEGPARPHVPSPEEKAKPEPSAVTPPSAGGPEMELKTAPPRLPERATPAQEGKADDEGAGSVFPIVGIGASAGGLEASTELLKALPADTGMAFVFVHHLAPEHESLLVDILARATPMPVSFASDGLRIEPDHVYVIPPNAFLAVFHGTLNLIRHEEPRGERTAIDYFLRSLSADQRNLAIGVVLSGTGSDGAIGVRAIKAEDGIALVQEPDTAAYDGMPRAALGTGLADFVLPPGAIAEELVRISRHPLLRPHGVRMRQPAQRESDEREMERIFIMLREAAGVDFTYYKPTTVKRRIGRRMIVHHVEHLSEYAGYLKEHPDEIRELYQDLLINVTGFFREPDSFEALQREVFPRLVEGRGHFDAIRIWVPGCSTGEEPYSLVMALTEFLDDKAVQPQIQVFATDISDTSIEKARRAVYPENITAEIPPGRLNRFFTRTESGYQVKKAIRDACVFAKHDVTRDPPFSRIDLISCRNLLIYLGKVIQGRLIPFFHYALNPRGYLFLGSSESIGSYADLFEIVDAKFKIYSKKPSSIRPPLDFGPRPFSTQQVGTREPVEAPRIAAADVQKAADRVALDRFAPPGVLVDQDMQIIQFRGDTGPYLRHAPGRATLDLLEMARKGLDTALHAHLPIARQPAAPIHIPGVQVVEDSASHVVDVEIMTVPGAGDRRYYLIFFRQQEPSTTEGKAGGRPSAKGRVAEESERLRGELTRTRDRLTATLEEKEATVEELRAANEEIQSSNEELQSINEELETAKEELQSTNEELTTLNEELQNRNFELLSMNDDFRNVLASVSIPIIILGKDMRIRRYTPMAERVLSLIPGDVGRPITDLQLKLDIPDLMQRIGDVVQNLSVSEREVVDDAGHWYRLQIRPYRTAEDKIEGVVIALFDLADVRARSAHAAQREEGAADVRAYLGSMLETMFEPFVVLDEQMRIIGSSAAFGRLIDARPGDLVGKLLDEIGAGTVDAKRLREIADEAEKKGSATADIVLALSSGEKRVQISAGRIERRDAAPIILMGLAETE